MDNRRYLGIDVLTASKERIKWAFDNFEKICISFSGGKDSTVMTHLVMEEAKKRNRKVALLFIDWEIQYKLTIEHVQHIYDMYKDYIIPYWVALPLLTDNACSMYEPEWISWDKAKENLWTRKPPKIAITDENYFPFYYYKITFEEFVPLFGEWYGEGKSTACFVGIRTRESLNRYRALTNKKKNKFEDKMFTTCVTDNVYNVYPIYDWSAEDDWKYFGKTKKPYNKLYDRFFQAGLTLHQMRVDEPFGDTTRRSLWLYQIIEPETWGKMVLRVNGANSGSLYSRDNGNILGNRSITLQKGHTWQSFSNFLLDTMPKKTAEHYKTKIAVYIKWYMNRGYVDGIPDEVDKQMEKQNDVPSWRRICQTLLRNDYWCKGLGFSPTKQSAYNQYLERMKKKRKEWNIYGDVDE
nr:MAG TPA: phosphoadenosine-phosphosulfate reductase [Caudoviricetes sp.]